MYDSSKVNYKEEEHDEASSLYEIIKAIEYEWKEDEDPGKIDFDDIISILRKASDDAVALIISIAKVPGVPGKVNKVAELANMIKRHEGWVE